MPIAQISAYSWTCPECGSTGLNYSAGSALRGLSVHIRAMHMVQPMAGQLVLPLPA